MGKSKRNIVTFELDDDVKPMLDKAIVVNGRKPYGYKTFKLNELLRDALIRSGYARKRDFSKAA